MIENEILISLDEIDGVDIEEEDIEELQREVEECTEMLEGFSDSLDEKLADINETKVYTELGVELSIDMNYSFSFEESE